MLNPKTGKKIFACQHHFDHAAKQNQSRYPWSQQIVSIGLLAVAGLQARAIDGNRTARLQTEATALAAETLEMLRLLPFDHPDLAPGDVRHRNLPADRRLYSVTWKTIADQPVAGTKTVQVRVGWLGGTAGKSVWMRTVIAKQPG